MSSFHLVQPAGMSAWTALTNVVAGGQERIVPLELSVGPLARPARAGTAGIAGITTRDAVLLPDTNDRFLMTEHQPSVC
jgi:hypothetical protein